METDHFSLCSRIRPEPLFKGSHGVTHARSFKSISLLVVLVFLMVSTGQLQASPDSCGAPRNVRTQALDELTWKRLNRINQQMAEQSLDDAKSAAQAMLDRAGRDPYLQAILLQALAQIAWSQQRYEESLDLFEQAVKLDTLRDETQFGIQYQIAQLNYLLERYAAALVSLEAWFCMVSQDRPDSTAWVLKASIHQRGGDFPSALLAIQTAISLDAEPKEPWFTLKLGAEYELGRYVAAADTLEQIIERWPDKKQYWVQLSQVRFQLEQPDAALAIMALAARNGLLVSESDIKWLANLYLSAGVPYRAADALNHAITHGVVSATTEHWLMVADAWYQAEDHDRALRAYQAAAESSSDGEVDLRRAYILLDREEWLGALEALNDSLEKSGMSEGQTAEAFLLRGVANFNLDRFDKAREDWSRASSDESTRESARQWLNHLREEQESKAS